MVIPLFAQLTKKINNRANSILLVPTGCYASDLQERMLLCGRLECFSCLKFFSQSYALIGRILFSLLHLCPHYRALSKLCVQYQTIEGNKISQHYNGVIIGAIASQITSLTIVYSSVYSDADQRKHQSSASLAFVRGIHRGPVNSPHKWPVTRKMFPFDEVMIKRNGVVHCA